MAQFNAENERQKRHYLNWKKDADGKDEKTLDIIAAAIRDFEMALGCKPFKAFKLDWARRYKVHLEKARHHRTGKPLSLTTRDARLRHVKEFFKWLASQPGYKSRIAFTDVEYFNNSAKDARAAHAQRPIEYPSMEQCAHAFRLMPESTVIQRRDKALFALLMLTAARDGSLASLRLCDVDLIENALFQDGRYVDTKNSKTIETWFLPVDLMYLECLAEWVRFLREDLLFGPTDALFPKPERTMKEGKFNFETLSRKPYCNGQNVNAIVKAAFKAAGLHTYTPHSFRKTLMLYANDLCDTVEEMKAVSLNIGHDNLATTINSYMPVSRDRQRELIRSFGAKSSRPA